MADSDEALSMLTSTQVARFLNVHTNTVRRWSSRGILKAYRVGPRGDRRFKQEDIVLLLQAGMVGSAGQLK